MIADDLLEALGNAIPGDHSRQVLADHYIPLLAATGRSIVDLGCGAGDSIEQFRASRPDVDWLGVDLAWSPEVAGRTRRDARFETFDGVNLPVPDGSIDAIYCKQVLEHARDPATLLSDVARVLRPAGWLAGSTSQLEPYHSLSVWNFTPLGLRGLVEAAGMRLVEIRPGIDGLALIAQRGLGMPSFAARWWSHQSPLNRAIAAAARVRRLDARHANAIKLLFCGQFAFLAEKRA